MAKQLSFIQPAGDSDEPLVDTPEAAKRLGIAAASLKRLAQQKRIPSVKYGRLRRFEPSALRAYIAKHRIG